MLKTTKCAAGDGVNFVNCAVNSDAITWYAASRSDQIGATLIRVLGLGDKAAIATVLSIQEVNQHFGLGPVELQRHDVAGRAGFDTPIYVVPTHIQSIRPAHSFFVITFTDGSVIEVKAITDLPIYD